MTARSLLTLLLLGCAPAYRDLDGRLIPAPRLVGDCEGGVVVVDSGAGRLRMIVELELDAEGPDRSVTTLPSVTVRVGQTWFVRPRRLVRDPPVCGRLPRGAPGGFGIPDREGGTRPDRTGQEACFAVLRAEFAVDEGLLAQSLAVVVGRRVYAVRWRF